MAGTAPFDQFTVINSQFGTTKVSYYTEISTAKVNSQQSLVFAASALEPTQSISSYASQSTSAGQTVTGVESTSYSVYYWTSSISVNIDISAQITLNSAVGNTKTMNQFVCLKFSAADYTCANAQIITDSSAVPTWSWQVYKKTSAPSSGDFVSSASAFTASDGFGATSTYFPELECQGTAANPSLGVATPTISSTKWRWNGTGNKYDVYKKVFDSTI